MDALLIGGTGSLGHALVPILLRKGYRITVLSREELKQKKMAVLYPEINYVLGDVRDYSSIEEHCIGKDVVFHLAAMKHVEMAEKNIDESIKINLLGTQNVAKAAKKYCNYAVFSSTDKAVLPINVYGMCKALSEKIWLDQNKHEGCRFSVFRWGNVIGSRGSVIHSFSESLQKQNKVYVTHPEMTRFFIRLNDAAAFMVDNFKFPVLDAPMLPVIRATSVLKLAEAVANYHGKANYQVEIAGIRPGEKMHEALDYHDHPAFSLTSDSCEQLSKEDLFTLVKEVLCLAS
jgi:UDP-N-acetylglucosamine 4,6-dehydratase